MGKGAVVILEIRPIGYIPLGALHMKAVLSFQGSFIGGSILPFYVRKWH